MTWEELEDRAINTTSNHRGLLKLMLRLPAMRGTLQVLNARSEEMRSLCEAFDDATSTLDLLTKTAATRNDPRVDEYQGLIQDLEGDIIRECLKKTGRLKDQ